MHVVRGVVRAVILRMNSTSRPRFISGSLALAVSALSFALAAPAHAQAVDATAGGTVAIPATVPAPSVFTVPTGGTATFGAPTPIASAAGSVNINAGNVAGATGTNVGQIVAASIAQQQASGMTAIPPSLLRAAAVTPNVVYVPYPIYMGGPSYAAPAAAGTGAETPALPGAQASESVDAPPQEPLIDYRSIPGGRANTDLADPAFRAAHIRRW